MATIHKSAFNNEIEESRNKTFRGYTDFVVVGSIFKIICTYKSSFGSIFSLCCLLIFFYIMLIFLSWYEMFIKLKEGLSVSTKFVLFWVVSVRKYMVKKYWILDRFDFFGPFSFPRFFNNDFFLVVRNLRVPHRISLYMPLYGQTFHPFSSYYNICFCPNLYKPLQLLDHDHSE